MFTDYLNESKNIKYSGYNGDNILDIEGFDYKKNKRFKIGKSVTVDVKTFKELYNEYTCNISRLNIFKDDLNFNLIHIGESLHDILTHNFLSKRRLNSTPIP